MALGCSKVSNWWGICIFLRTKYIQCYLSNCVISFVMPNAAFENTTVRELTVWIKSPRTQKCNLWSPALDTYSKCISSSGSWCSWSRICTTGQKLHLQTIRIQKLFNILCQSYHSAFKNTQKSELHNAVLQCNIFNQIF